MGLQFSITAIGSVMLQSAVNSLGSSIVAAFTAGMKVKQFTMAFFDAIGNTSATFCGQESWCTSAGSGMRKGMRQMLGIAFAYGIVASFALIFLGEPMIRIFVDRGRDGSDRICGEISALYGILLLAACLFNYDAKCRFRDLDTALLQCLRDFWRWWRGRRCHCLQFLLSVIWQPALLTRPRG